MVFILCFTIGVYYEKRRLKNFPTLIKNRLHQRHFTGDNPKKDIAANLECAILLTFSRIYSKISLENHEKLNITYNLETKFYSELFMSSSFAPDRRL